MEITRKQASRNREMAKRCRLPFEISMPCPKCGTKATVDLDKNYLSYPIPGETAALYFGCREERCGADWQGMVVFDVVLREAPPEP